MGFRYQSSLLTAFACKATLSEEEATDKALSKLAESDINPAAGDEDGAEKSASAQMRTDPKSEAQMQVPRKKTA